MNPRVAEPLRFGAKEKKVLMIAKSRHLATAAIVLAVSGFGFFLYNAHAQTGELSTASGTSEAKPAAPAQVDAARLVGADKDPGDWMTYGRNYNEQRFSPLNKINADNVKNLGLAWY